MKWLLSQDGILLPDVPFRRHRGQQGRSFWGQGPGGRMGWPRKPLPEKQGLLALTTDVIDVLK